MNLKSIISRMVIFLIILLEGSNVFLFFFLGLVRLVLRIIYMLCFWFLIIYEKLKKNDKN